MGNQGSVPPLPSKSRSAELPVSRLKERRSSVPGGSSSVDRIRMKRANSANANLVSKNVLFNPYDKAEDQVGPAALESSLGMLNMFDLDLTDTKVRSGLEKDPYEQQIQNKNVLVTHISEAVNRLRILVPIQELTNVLAQIVSHCSKYPRIRIAAAGSDEAVAIYKALGLQEEGEYLVLPIPDRKKIMEARDYLLLVLGEAESSLEGHKKLLVSPQELFLSKPNSKVKFCEIFEVGAAVTQGKRQTQEDEIVVSEMGIFAVFDGHGGRLAAVLCALLTEEVFLDALSNKVWVEKYNRRAGASKIEVAFGVLFETLHTHIVASRITSGTTGLICWITQEQVHSALGW